MGSFELGRMEESVADFVHGACNHPGAAPLIAGKRAKAPKTNAEARDLRVGNVFRQNLKGYLAQNGLRARRFFGALIANPNFVALMGEIEEVRHRSNEERGTNIRAAWNLLEHMKSYKFAMERAADICRSLRSGRAVGRKALAR